MSPKGKQCKITQHKTDASWHYREVLSITQNLIQWSLTFDTGAFGTPQTVFKRPVSVDK